MNAGKLRTEEAIMESQDQDQLWACKACKTVRAWGTGAPLDPAFVPLLHCKRCGGPQRFVHVVRRLERCGLHALSGGCAGRTAGRGWL